MPRDDAHPFWLAIDDLGSAVVEALSKAGINTDELLQTWATENGSHLTISSDRPSNATYFWVYLPREPAAQAAVLKAVLFHLARARKCLADADWSVALGETSLIWDGDEFYVPN